MFKDAAWFVTRTPIREMLKLLLIEWDNRLVVALFLGGLQDMKSCGNDLEVQYMSASDPQHDT